jgi:hypothetical protein
MPIREHCLVCGMDLEFIPGMKPGTGEYLHRFTSENYGQYKFVHMPHFALQLNLFDRMPYPRSRRGYHAAK